MGLIKERIKSGEECCKLANQRFGLMMALKSALVKIGRTNDEAVKATEHAKNREIIEFNRILDNDIDNTLMNYIETHHSDNIATFAKSQGVSPSQAGRWLKRNCVVIDGTVYCEVSKQVKSK